MSKDKGKNDNVHKISGGGKGCDALVLAFLAVVGGAAYLVKRVVMGAIK